MSRCITAICEMSDQDCGIEVTKIIKDTRESILAFEHEMYERMDVFGYYITYYSTLIPDLDREDEIYKWMNDNKKYEIERDYE